jgi:hypothetical protein
MNPLAHTIHVVASSIEGTRQALHVATAMARGSGARVALLLRRTSPDGLVPNGDINNDNSETIVQTLVEDFAPKPSVIGFVSRRPIDVVQLLEQPAVVVIGGESRRWWPSAEQRLARDLTRLGCQVTFVQVTQS